MGSRESDGIGNPRRNVNKAEIEPILTMLAFLAPEVRAIDPLSEYFLLMCRMSLLEAEQKKGECSTRH